MRERFLTNELDSDILERTSLKIKMICGLLCITVNEPSLRGFYLVKYVDSRLLRGHHSEMRHKARKESDIECGKNI